MSEIHSAASPIGDAPSGKAASAKSFYGSELAAFVATTFLSALLLFSIQPLFAKMVLPVLGGSPSVWAVALCFFQGALLVGYCYAHGLIRWLRARTTGYVHLGLSAAALLALPIGIPAGWIEPPPGDPSFWQLGLFAVAIGLPFVAVSANAPLLQAWFARTDHPHARDPYFLYAASNLGSLLALLGYPFVLEPLFGLSALSLIWTGGFVLLIGALAGCFVLVARAPEAASAKADASPSTRVTWLRRAGWVGLAFVPSGLLTAFTAHVTTDVASAPLLWVLPLSLYLLTFVIVFRDRALIPPWLLLPLHFAAVLAALLVLSQTEWDKWVETSATGVLAFFTAALVAHRTLYETRPDASRLTEFYLWMSLGGVLGGLFAALVAPKLFSEIFEYPLLLALSMACRPGVFTASRDRLENALLAVSLLAGAIAIGYALRGVALSPATLGEWSKPVFSRNIPYAGVSLDQLGSTFVLAALFAVLALLAIGQPLRQFAMVAFMGLTVMLLPSAIKRGDAQRSYFGVYRVSQSNDGEFNILTHGTTLHGAQRIRDAEGNPVADATPGTYYYPESPMAKAVGLVRGRLMSEEGRTGRYAVIGLGSGSLACLSKGGERWRFFEIDPLVVSISRHSGYFTYLENCQPQTDIVIGDARLTMAKETDGSFDLIVVDAFTSDAIPVHLMTVEALRLYLSKLNDKGVAVLHISNRYLDLDDVLGAGLNLTPGVHGLLVSDDEADGSYSQTSSTIAVFSRSPEALDAFRTLRGVSDIDRDKLTPWTDDASDILGPLLSRLRN